MDPLESSEPHCNVKGWLSMYVGTGLRGKNAKVTFGDQRDENCIKALLTRSPDHCILECLLPWPGRFPPLGDLLGSSLGFSYFPKLCPFPVN